MSGSGLQGAKARPVLAALGNRQAMTLLAQTRVGHTGYVNLDFTGISSDFDPHQAPSKMLAQMFIG